jgi:FMN phosphatase YigB (HAD superfamily)
LIPPSERYVSESFGAGKESGIIHRAIRTRFGTSTIFCVGDSVEADLEPGAAVGMKPIWATAYCDPRELKKVPPKGTKRIPSIRVLGRCIRGYAEPFAIE